MRDVGEYLRAYWAYVSTHLGWTKALMLALLWLAGMFAPLAAKTLVELPNSIGIPWMIGHFKGIIRPLAYFIPHQDPDLIQFLPLSIQG